MKVRWLIDIAGTVHGDPNGVRRGQITEIDDAPTLQRYLDHGYATCDLKGEMPRPFR